mgnify:CR=1 FL=1
MEYEERQRRDRKLRHSEWVIWNEVFKYYLNILVDYDYK